VDDFLLLSDDRRQLQRWRGAVIERLASLRLTLHAERAQLYPTVTGVPFLGFRVYPTHRRLKARNGHHFARRFRAGLRKLRRGQWSFAQLNASVQGWVNHVRFAQTFGLRRQLLSATTLPRE
jgi:hypothetical protein